MRQITVLALTTTLALLVAGCAGGTSDASGEGGSSDGVAHSANSPQQWAADECPVLLSTTTTGNIFALTQAPLSPILANFPTEGRASMLGLYSLDETSGTAIAKSQMSGDSVFCYNSENAATAKEAVEEVSGETQTFVPVETPDGTAYIVDYAGFSNHPNGIRYNGSAMEIENENSGNVPYVVSASASLDDSALESAEPEAVDPCKLLGSLCA